MKKLRIVHEEPQYTNLHPKSAKPYSLFKSVYTNNTERPQEYSFKTERTTESVVSVAREQGYSIGQEAELSLKTPCTIYSILLYYCLTQTVIIISKNSQGSLR